QDNLIPSATLFFVYIFDKRGEYGTFQFCKRCR
ncbi:uridine kinase, partial [Salmonella enterica]|nr:uridine kinase [Salmonella enterica]